MTSLKNLSRNKHRIIALQEQTAARPLHISITKRFITTTIQTIVWQFRVLLTSFMLSLVLKFFKRKSNKSHVRTVNVAILNDTTLQFEWLARKMLIDVHLLLQKQNKEWSDSSSESNLKFYLIYFQEITQQVELYLSLRESEDFSKFCFFAHFKKLRDLSLTGSSNDSEFHQVPFLQKMKQSTTNGSKYGWTTIPLSSPSSINYTGSRIIPSPTQNHQSTKNSTVIFKLPLFKNWHE